MVVTSITSIPDVQYSVLALEAVFSSICWLFYCHIEDCSASDISIHVRFFFFMKLSINCQLLVAILHVHRTF